MYLHSFLPESGAISEWFRTVITYSGVPFFFITSGFFFKKGLMKNGHSIEYLRRYAWRVGKMYLAWSIITLPVSWLCIEWGHSDYSTPLKIVYLFRMFFFSGSCGIYWYLLALFVCCFIIYYFSVRKKSIWLYLIAALLFIIGVIYDSPYNNGNICLVVDYNFKRGTLTGFFSALAFCFITYYLLNRLLTRKQMALLFG